MNEETEYLIERFDVSKIKDLEKLFIEVYKRSTPENYFANKYNTFYTNVSYIAYIAYAEKKAVAFYGAIPCFFQYEKEILLAAQLADAMTHPEHRNKGLFNTLTKMCADLCRQNGVQFVFGFPNQNSFPHFIKLGYTTTETMACFQIKLPVTIYKKLLGKISISNKKNISEKYFTVENGIESSVINDGFAGVYRDRNYFQYKKYRKTIVLKIGDSKVWISITNSLNIGDIICTKKDFDTVMNELKKIGNKLGISPIYFHTSIHTLLFEQFSARYKSMPSFPVIFLNFNNNIDVAKIKFTYADIDIF